MVLAHNIEDTLRTQDIKISRNVTFDTMLLGPNTLQGLKKVGFHKPSPIQLHGIPLGKCGFDLLLEAKSGTGKTAVFTVICLEKLNLSEGLQAIILAPTREIAAQICDVIKQIGSCYEGLNVAVVMGGLPVHEDVAKFKNKNVHIVVGSPGRLRQMIEEKHIDVSSIRLLVLDEADKLLSKSFLPDINYMYSLLPREKQVIMSSATYTEETKDFIKRYVQSAQHVCPDSTNVLLGIAQKVTIVKHHSNIVKQTKLRFEELLKILTKIPFKQCLIFCNYQVRIAELYKMLTKEKWPAQQLYSCQEQLNRLGALKALQEYKCRILICTDLAARGIDASNIDLVINFEPPYEWQTYLHRIGRAGRYGSYGIAISILSEGQEKKRFIEIIKEIRAPIYLTNLWNDEPFFLENSDGMQNPKNILKIDQIEIKENLASHYDLENDYPLLWKVLNSDPKQGTHGENESNKTVSFEYLCDDFNKQKIELFSDLISSLDIYETKKDLKEKSIGRVEDKTYCEDNNNNKSSRNVDSLLHVNHKNINMIDKVNNDINLLENNENYSDGKTMDSMEALLNAGLPTAFGSSKLKNQSVSKSSKFTKYNTCRGTSYNDRCPTNLQKNNKSYKYDLPSLYNMREQDYSDLGQNNIIPDCYKHLRTTNHTEPRLRDRKTESDSSDLSEDEDSIQEKVPFTAKKKNANININKTLTNSNVYTDDYDCHYDFLNYQNKASGSKTFANYNSTNLGNGSSNKYRKSKHEKSSGNNAYLTWYNNLKYRVKQIELALYINEMSQLYSQ